MIGVTPAYCPSRRHLSTSRRMSLIRLFFSRRSPVASKSNPSCSDPSPPFLPFLADRDRDEGLARPSAVLDLASRALRADLVVPVGLLVGRVEDRVVDRCAHAYPLDPIPTSSPPNHGPTRRGSRCALRSEPAPTVADGA